MVTLYVTQDGLNDSSVSKCSRYIGSGMVTLNITQDSLDDSSVSKCSRYIGSGPSIICLKLITKTAITLVLIIIN